MANPDPTHPADRLLSMGDRQAAIEVLEELTSSDPSFADWLKLAALYRAEGADARALKAVDHALAVRPLDFSALLSKAVLLERLASGDADEAFSRALAQQPEGRWPGALATIATHARARADAFKEASDRKLRAAADAVPPATTEERARIDRFRTNILHDTKPFHSEPSHFHFPGLSEREFHDRSDFPWLTALEAAVRDIESEFEGLRRSSTAEQHPYLRYADHEPIGAFGDLNHSRDWTAFHLLEDGKRIERNASRCPRTMAALEKVRQPLVGRMSPSAMFSVLAPGTHIPPHCGVTNTRLICHLPLTVPEGCWFRVGCEKRFWTPGEAFVFDDTIEHEAMNPSSLPRVVLIFDVWHPGLSENERAAVAAMIASQ